MCVNCTPKSHFAFVCLFRSETPAGSSLSQLIIQILRRGLWKAAYLAALPLTEIIPAEMMLACSSHMLRKQQRQGGSRWLAVFICHRLLNSLVLHHSDVCSGFWPGYFYCDIVLLYFKYLRVCHNSKHNVCHRLRRIFSLYSSRLEGLTYSCTSGLISQRFTYQWLVNLKISQSPSPPTHTLTAFWKCDIWEQFWNVKMFWFFFPFRLISEF